MANKRPITWVVKEGGCWECTSHRAKQNGYPTIHIPKKKSPVYLSTFLLMQKAGDRPRGLSRLHKCNNKWCINPDHLYWGTQRQNTVDYLLAGRKLKDFELRKAIAEDSSGNLMELANKYHVSPGYIRTQKTPHLWHKLFGVKLVPPQPHAKIKRKYGYTLQEIGDYMGITRERVRQLVEKNSPRIGPAVAAIDKQAEIWINPI